MPNYCPNCGFKLSDSSADEKSHPTGLQGVVASENEVKPSILSDYSLPEDNQPKPAVPKVYDYRERFKRHKLRIDDVTTKSKVLENLPRQDTELDKYGNLVVGEGLVQEF